MDIKEALNRVVNQLDLNTAEMQDVMREIMTGQCTDAQVGAFLMGMRMKSETIDEIVGAVSVMRELAKRHEITMLYSVSGRYDLCAMLLTDSTQELDAVIDRIRSVQGVTDTFSTIMLSTKLDRPE